MVLTGSKISAILSFCFVSYRENSLLEPGVAGTYFCNKLISDIVLVSHDHLHRRHFCPKQGQHLFKKNFSIKTLDQI
jgi:hypothetical protein